MSYRELGHFMNEAKRQDLFNQGSMIIDTKKREAFLSSMFYQVFMIIDPDI